MAKAVPTSETSFSSILAESLISSIGLTDTISEVHIKPSIRKRLAKSFTDRVRRLAGTPELWGRSAKTLSVNIDSNDKVSVNLEGSVDEVLQAQMLEYGTPDLPPRAVMRTAEADFTEEYKVMMRDYEL
jgi:hypothetical protein